MYVRALCIMAHVIAVADDVYRELRQMKGRRSFSQLIRELLRRKEKKQPKEALLTYIRELERRYGGKKKDRLSERVDEVLYR